MDLNNERRSQRECIPQEWERVSSFLTQQIKSPCEAHGMVRWGSPETPSQL